MGWKAFGRANLLLRSKKLPILHKRKFLDQCITPTITYGAETWVLNRKLAIKLRNTQRAMERTMLNISLKEHQTAESIRQKTKVKDILETIGKMKWRWGGHIMRRNDERWTKRITDWYPQTVKRKRGRPPMRWEDDLLKFKSTWRNDAQYRDYWKGKEKYF